MAMKEEDIPSSKLAKDGTNFCEQEKEKERKNQSLSNLFQTPNNQEKDRDKMLKLNTELSICYTHLLNGPYLIIYKYV